jgi:hypothetical protein
MEKLTFGGIFTVTCYDKEGNVKWKERTPNLVVNQGLDHILDITFMGGSPYSNFYIGLLSDNPTITADDTLDSHSGWSEITDYTEGERQEFVESVSGQTIDNSGNLATFSINNAAVIGGSFITSASTGTTGILMAASAFSNGEKNVSDGDTLEVMYEFRASSS